MEVDDIFILLAMIVIYFSGYAIGVTQNNAEEYQHSLIKTEQAIESFKMYYDEKYKTSFNQTPGVTGLAFGDYIAVWTKGRNITAVLDTCTHEYAHNNLGMKD